MPVKFELYTQHRTSPEFKTKIYGAKQFTVVQWKPALRKPILNGQFSSLPDENLKIFTIEYTP